MTVARTRISRYRPKGSHLWVMCFPEAQQRRGADLWDRCRRLVNDHCLSSGDISGFALVIWHENGATTADVANWGNLPGILIPDLVRNRLLGDKIEQWTIDRINGV